MPANKNSKKSNKRLWITALAVVLVIGAVGGYAYYRHTSKAKPVTTASAESKGPSTEITSSSSGTNSAKGDTSDSTSDQTTKNTNPPDKPSGTFVSNHTPRLSSEDLANQENSVCITTSGASCTITFIKGSQTISLPKQETDAGGATYWTWKLQDYGITEGTWTIKAVATMNGQTVSADDPTGLVVTP